MPILRRLNALPEPVQQVIFDVGTRLNEAGIAHQNPALRHDARQAFDNRSKFTLVDRNDLARQAQYEQLENLAGFLLAQRAGDSQQLRLRIHDNI